MYSFKNDYAEGMHPNILEALARSNLSQEDGYGEDSFCTEARSTIKQHLGTDDSDIHFVVGGTLCNLLIISSILQPIESVVSSSLGHIAKNETGAIEATGHKIHTINSIDGKISPEQIQGIIDEHTDEHSVIPRLVYISNSTELGTVHTKKELTSLSQYCKANDLLLFADGARLGAALVSKKNDMNLAEFSSLVDIFYIGGTKNGAILGEAIVINNNALKAKFRYYMKHRGALLAKGRLLGIQFSELFKDNLYFDLAKHSDTMAEKIYLAIKSLGYSFLAERESNQVFPIFPNEIIETLEKDFAFYKWKKIDEHSTALRLICSWASEEEQVNKLISTIKDISYK